MGAQANGDGVAGLQLLDQAVGHGPAQRTAARQDRDVRGILGQV
jgi:hypothetical protein